MIVNAGYRGKVGGAPKFTYTGQYNVRDDGVVELLTSGTIVFLEPSVIDVFMVGGGGAGGGSYGSTDSFGNGGGGGGYTRTEKKMSVNGEYSITIGQGGVPLNNEDGSDGGTTTWGNITVNGGKGGDEWGKGGAGGSGGGGGVISSTSGGDGGHDGGKGSDGTSYATGGAGQGYSTKEFGEIEGKLYAGGGGGGRYLASSSGAGGMGGSGGGGTGAWARDDFPNVYTAAAAGVANTGGGGGGGVSARWDGGATIQGAAGGSGIVCFRAAK